MDEDARFERCAEWILLRTRLQEPRHAQAVRRGLAPRGIGQFGRQRLAGEDVVFLGGFQCGLQYGIYRWRRLVDNAMASDCVQSCVASKRGSSFSNFMTIIVARWASSLFNEMKYFTFSASFPTGAGDFPVRSVHWPAIV